MAKKIISEDEQQAKIKHNRDRVREYSRSEHGKQVKKEYIKKNIGRIRAYNREYFARRRRESASLGICACCLKPKDVNGTYFCNICRDRMRLNSRMQAFRMRKQLAKKSTADGPKSYAAKEGVANNILQSIKKGLRVVVYRGNKNKLKNKIKG